MKMWKVYDNNNDIDDGQRTNFYQKSSLEPSAKVSNKTLYYYIIYKGTNVRIEVCYVSNDPHKSKTTSDTKQQCADVVVLWGTLSML